MTALVFWISTGLIVYAYAGYPLALFFLSRFRLIPEWNINEQPSVSLVIAAYNEEQAIAQKLDNSLGLDYPRDRLQILVAVDGGQDQTLEIVKQYADKGIECNFKPGRNGKMAAINRIMQKTRGEIILFSDANNLFSTQAIKQLIKPFSDASVGAVTGSKNIIQGDGLLGESESLYWRYESYIKQLETRLGCCTAVAGEILAVRKSLFQSPPDQVINDDFYLATDLIKRGYRVIYQPQAKSFERISATAADEIKRRARIIAGRYQALANASRLIPFNRPIIAWQLISHKFLRPLVPFAMILALLANAYAVIIPPVVSNATWFNLGYPYNWLLLSLQGLFYGAAWLGNQRKQKGWFGKVLYLPTFLVNSNWAALIGFYRYLTGKQTALWERVQRSQ